MFALMTETHSQISKFLYYARHYLLNASGKFIFLLDLGLSSLVTLLACYYGEWIYKGDWVDKHMGVPPSTFSRVLFPEPLAPMTATNSPWFTVRLMSFSTAMSSEPDLKLRLRRVTEMTGELMAGRNG